MILDERERITALSNQGRRRWSVPGGDRSDSRFVLIKKIDPVPVRSPHDRRRGPVACGSRRGLCQAGWRSGPTGHPARGNPEFAAPRGRDAAELPPAVSRAARSLARRRARWRSARRPPPASRSRSPWAAETRRKLRSGGSVALHLASELVPGHRRQKVLSN